MATMQTNSYNYATTNDFLFTDSTTLNEVTCKHCHRTKLDRVSCTNQRGHELKDMSPLVDRTFERFTQSFTVDQSEKSDLGLARRSNKNIDDLLRLTPEEYGAELDSDAIFKELINYLFPKEITEKIREFETKEKEFHDGVKHFLMESRKEFNRDHKELSEDQRRQQWKTEELKLRAGKGRSPHTKFKELLPQELLIEVANSSITPASRHFVEFVNAVTSSIFATIHESEAYQQYLTETIGGPITVTKIGELYKEFCLEAFEQISSYSTEVFFSAQALSDFLQFQVVYSITMNDQRRRNAFLAGVKKYKESGENAYSDYVKHLKHFILVKLLKHAECELLIPRPSDPYKTKYMISALLEVNRPYNHTLGVSLTDVRLKYRFRNPFGSSKKGLRKITHTGSSQEEKFVYDFLEFYTSIQPSETIAMITYKQGEDVRVKTYDMTHSGPGASSSGSSADGSPTSRTTMDDEDEEMVGLLEKYADYTAIYFSFNHNEITNNRPVTPRRAEATMSGQVTITAKALFDHYTSYCYLSGTNDEIRRMMEVLNSLPGISLANQEFISFTGTLEVKTRAILVKPILEQILLIPPLARYWYPKSMSSVAGNYVYIYTPEGVSVPIETSDYVSMQVHPLRQYTLTDKVWSLEFKGNRQSQVVPFISMTIALLQMVENIIYDKRFDLYRRTEHDYIMHYRKHQRSGSVESTSGAVGPMLQYGLTKREIYTASLKVAGLTKEEIDRYEDRLRPFILPLMENESDVATKWKTFYASVIASINPLFERAQFTDFRIGIIRPGQHRESDMEAYNEFKSAFDSLQLTYGDEAGEEVVELRYNDNPIGLMFQRLQRGPTSHGFLFLCYPEKGNVYYMEMKGGLPIRSAKYIGRGEATSPQQRFQVSTQRKRDIKQEIREIVGQFTSAQPEKITFFNPQGAKKYKEYILEIFPPNILRVLLAQHLWDHTREQMIEKIDKLNVYLQQDMLQNLLGAMIFCFVIDPVTKQYTFQMPRHNQWYAVSSEYQDVSFLFQTRHGNYEIVLFRGASLTTPIDDRMRNYIKQGLFKEEEIPSLKYSDVYENLRPEDTLEGQLFNTNGKCVGFRVRTIEEETVEDRTIKRERIMDLRVNPQSPIMASHKSGIKAPQAKRLTYLTDSRTNVDEKFGLFADDDRFTLIQQRQIGVQMRISKLYEQSREWKHRIYLFSRMVLNHWMLWRSEIEPAVQTEEAGEEQDTVQEAPPIAEMIGEYVARFIKSVHPTRVIVEQEITWTVMPETHNSVAEFSSYLTRVYPNVFHDGVFHVVESELEKMRAYMAREIDLIKSYPPSFVTHFMNSRIDTKLVGSQRPASVGTELIGVASIAESVRVAHVKQDLSNNTYYLYMNRFDSDVDPISITKQQAKKAELVLIEHNKKLYFLRLTRVGVFETACYIAHMWHKEKKIMRYEETNHMTTSARRFTLRNKEIVENPDNDVRQIFATGQDYWILGYTRFESPQNGRGNPVEKTAYAAMLPL